VENMPAKQKPVVVVMSNTMSVCKDMLVCIATQATVDVNFLPDIRSGLSGFMWLAQ